MIRTTHTAVAPKLDQSKTQEACSQALLLSDTEAAALLGSSRSHFRNMHRLGNCPAPIKFGRSTKWRKAELIDWINEGSPPRHRWHWNRNKGGRS